MQRIHPYFAQKQSTNYSMTRKSSTVKPRVDASRTDSGQEMMPRRSICNDCIRRAKRRQKTKSGFASFELATTTRANGLLVQAHRDK